VDRATEGFIVWSPNGRLLYANREAARITGYTEEQLVERRLHDLLPPQELNLALARMERRLSGEPITHRHESTLIHRDGTLIPLEVTGTAVRWYGQPASMSILRDITKRKAAERELACNAEAQQVLYREVNHRVKNNLAAIIGVLLKEQRRAEMEGNTAYLPVLRSLVGRVMGLATVHGMLSAAEWRPLLIHDLTAQVISAAVQSVADPSLIRVQITPSSLQVGSEQAQHLALVINELAANSVKHALDRRGGVRIRVGINVVGSALTLVYSDDGPGFPEAMVRDDFSGANVGFDLIRGIVRKSLRGELRLANDGGAVATITFELQDAPPE
jgi:PAS domain S-box-containing protein